MKKVIYVLILPLVVVSGLVFANREIKNETSLKTSTKPFKWADSPDGKKFKKWEASPEGKKVHVSGEKIMKYIKNPTNMEAVVTSLSLPQPASGEGLNGIMVRINGEAYIINFGYSINNFGSFSRANQDLQFLKSLKVNDKIVVRSYRGGYSPSYPYFIISGNYVERNSKILFKRNFGKDVCFVLPGAPGC